MTVPGAGVKTWLAATALQHEYAALPGNPMSGLLGTTLALRRPRSTTTCMGPVEPPTRTRTCETTPLPAGGKGDSPVWRLTEYHAQLGCGWNGVKSGHKPAWIDGGRDRSVPKGMA